MTFCNASAGLNCSADPFTSFLSEELSDKADDEIVDMLEFSQKDVSSFAVLD